MTEAEQRVEEVRIRLFEQLSVCMGVASAPFEPDGTVSRKMLVAQAAFSAALNEYTKAVTNAVNKTL